MNKKTGEKPHSPGDLLLEASKGLKVLDGRGRVLDLDVGRGAVVVICCFGRKGVETEGERERRERKGKKSGSGESAPRGARSIHGFYRLRCFRPLWPGVLRGVKGQFHASRARMKRTGKREQARKESSEILRRPLQMRRKCDSK